MKRLIWKPFFHLLLQARLPWFYILVYTLLSMAASQLYLLFPSYTRQIMNGSPESGAYLYSNCRCFRTGMYSSVSQFILAAASAKVSLRLRELIWRQILRLPVPFFDAQPSKDLISRVTQDTAKLSDLAVSFPGNVLSSLYTFFGSFVLLFSYHWKPL